MAVGMVSAFGRDVAVGRRTMGAEGTCCVRPGFGIYMGAQLTGAGVADGVQLEIHSVHTSRIKQ